MLAKALILLGLARAGNAGAGSRANLKTLFAWGPGEVCYALDPGLLSKLRHSGRYVPHNNVPLGVAVHPYVPKIFTTVPRWKPGVLSTLNWIPVGTGNPKEALRPYPNFEVNNIYGNFWTNYKIVSATRMFIDDCDRLWVIDNGYNDQCGNKSQILPPKLLIFDVKTDKLLHIHVFPPEVRNYQSSFGKVVVDVKNDCDCTVAYISDVRNPGLVVFDLKKDYSFRIKHNYLEKEPLKSQYSAQGSKFNSGNHIDGLALGPRLPNGHRNLFVSAQTSNKQFGGSTELLQDAKHKDNVDLFNYIGDRCSNCLSGGAQDFDDKTGIMFYSDLHSNAISCWNGDINNFGPATQDNITASSMKLEYVSDLWVTRGRELIVISDQLRRFFHSDSGVSTVILVGEVDQLVSGTACQPRHPVAHPGFLNSGGFVARGGPYH